MLTPVGEGVWIHRSAFMSSNAVVVQGADGVLLVDPGVTTDEITCLAADLGARRQRVALGFSTHPHWDHLLWHDALGPVPRFGTDRGAATARARLSDPGATARVAAMLPADIANEVPLDLLGGIAGLPPGAVEIAWDGPTVQVVEHAAHAPGHAALIVEGAGVLMAGDMVSDLLIPVLDLTADEAIDDYLAGLARLETTVAVVETFVPGHGSVGDADELRERIDLDRAYVEALRAGRVPDDPRIAAAIADRQDWLADLDERQRRRCSPSGSTAE